MPAKRVPLVRKRPSASRTTKLPLSKSQEAEIVKLFSAVNNHQLRLKAVVSSSVVTAEWVATLFVASRNHTLDWQHTKPDDRKDNLQVELFREARGDYDESTEDEGDSSAEDVY